MGLDSSFMIKGRVFMIAFRPDGRSCHACASLDTSLDPLTGLNLRWHYSPVAGVNQGRLCWFCGRVWQGHWKLTYQTLKKFEAALGVESEMPEAHKTKRAFLVEQVLEQGTYDVKIVFQEKTTVESIDRRRKTLESTDLHIELEYYKSTHEGGKGDPMTNGLGHKVCWLEGVLGVMIPGPPIRKVKSARESFVDVRKIEDDGTCQFSENHMQTVAAAIAAGIGNFGNPSSASSPSSSGGSVRRPAALLPHKVQGAQAAPAAVKMETPSPSVKREAPPDSLDGNPFGFQLVVPTIPGAAPDDTSANRRTGGMIVTTKRLPY